MGRNGFPDLKCFPPHSFVPLDGGPPDRRGFARRARDSGDRVYGIQTLRAKENFPVSGLRASQYLIRAYGLLKLACVRTNLAQGSIDARRGSAIERAAQEVGNGKWDNEFIVDVFRPVPARRST